MKHLGVWNLIFFEFLKNQISNFFIYPNYSDLVRHISASFRPIGAITTSLYTKTILYTQIPVIRTANPNNCKAWKGCHPMANETPHMTNVRTESNTMRVVADNYLVTEIPAKLKNAIENVFCLYFACFSYFYLNKKVVELLSIRRQVFL